MKPRLREHIDGIGDGLSIALRIAETSRSLREATLRIEEELLAARRAKDLDNVATIQGIIASLDVAGGGSHATAQKGLRSPQTEGFPRGDSRPIRRPKRSVPL